MNGKRKGVINPSLLTNYIINDAISYFEIAIKINPRSSIAFSNLGYCLTWIGINSKNPIEKLEKFNQAIAKKTRILETERRSLIPNKKLIKKSQLSIQSLTDMMDNQFSLSN